MNERAVAAFARFRDRFVGAGVDAILGSKSYDQDVARHVFGNARADRPTWAFDRRTQEGRQVSVKRIFEELVDEKGEPSFEYEMVYGAIGSDLVHSGPFSVTRIMANISNKSTFSLQVAPMRRGCFMALVISNVAMILVLEALNQFVHLGLNDVLSELKAANMNLSTPVRGPESKS
jgi:hypothetical protein